MRFLLDVCAASRSMRETLVALGHDVMSAAEESPSASDAELLSQALAEERILVTEDKDFGELVFVQRMPHPCIIRFTELAVIEKVEAMRELIDDHSDAMREGHIIVVTRNRVRIRRRAD